MDKPRYAEAVFGCLLGGAWGDAFDLPIEFMSLKQIQAQHSPCGLQAPLPTHGKLLVSDDTQITLYTLEGLLLTDTPALDGYTESIRIVYLDWQKTQLTSGATGHKSRGRLWRCPALRDRRSPGRTCIEALEIHRGRGTVQNRLNQSKGNGGVIRAAPVGLMVPWLSPEQCFELGARSAATTHCHLQERRT